MYAELAMKKMQDAQAAQQAKAQMDPYAARAARQPAMQRGLRPAMPAAGMQNAMAAQNASMARNQQAMDARNAATMGAMPAPAFGHGGMMRNAPITPPPGVGMRAAPWAPAMAAQPMAMSPQDAASAKGWGGSAPAPDRMAPTLPAATPAVGGLMPQPSSLPVPQVGAVAGGPSNADVMNALAQLYAQMNAQRGG